MSDAKEEVTFGKFRAVWHLREVDLLGWSWENGYFGITADSNCCENFGCQLNGSERDIPEDENMMFKVNPDKLYSVRNWEIKSNKNESGWYDEEVSIHIDGFTLSVYNQHNGYYSHGVYFINGDYRDETSI